MRQMVSCTIFAATKGQCSARRVKAPQQTRDRAANVLKSGCAYLVGMNWLDTLPPPLNLLQAPALLWSALRGPGWAGGTAGPRTAWLCWVLLTTPVQLALGMELGMGLDKGSQARHVGGTQRCLVTVAVLHNKGDVGTEGAQEILIIIREGCDGCRRV